jgi:hypothetical protein
MQLAAMDNQRFFRDLLDVANYANVSFYPIDPRGLAVFDNPIGPDAPPPITVDMAMLKTRIEALRTMALNTDGVAVVDTNDLDAGLRRIADDLTSYYLLGYYSTNTKLDGRYRSLKVRVKQPGVDVRARRGYRAASEAEVTASRTAADAPVPEATRTARAAIDKLARVRPEGRFYINAVPANGTLWVAGELQAPGSRPDEFAEGGIADIDVSAGSVSKSARVTLKPGERTFLTTVALPSGSTGEIGVKARLVPTGGSAIPLTDAIRVDASPSAGGQALLFRRGATTGNRVVPAADFRFSRTERLHLEIPAGPDTKAGAGRMLDRAGQPLQVPVTTGQRSDETSGQHWITADVILGPMGAGEYALEVEILGGPAAQRIVTGIRVTR